MVGLGESDGVRVKGNCDLCFRSIAGVYLNDKLHMWR